MTPFFLEISRHAKERIKQRRITRKKIRDCIIHGDLLNIDYRERRTRALKFGAKTLEVIYLEIKMGYLVVTAYWRQ
ncbi:MAG TPA: DUF4258 domain-containing protein [Bdellovibrionota bacterium]|nr:DUF4258 domain-containing protein [Bdellovibrionota bacterium]